jgi:hypothetical protein
MEKKDLTAGEREATFILKNEFKTYTEIAKLLKICRISTRAAGGRRKTTKLDNERIVIISKRNRHLTASDITSEMNQSLLMYASCIYGETSPQ